MRFGVAVVPAPAAWVLGARGPVVSKAGVHFKTKQKTRHSLGQTACLTGSSTTTRPFRRAPRQVRGWRTQPLTRKCEMTQELNEQEEVERGALGAGSWHWQAAGKSGAAQVHAQVQCTSAVQNGRSVDRRAVGVQHFLCEGCVTGDRHATR